MPTRTDHRSGAHPTGWSPALRSLYVFGVVAGAGLAGAHGLSLLRGCGPGDLPDVLLGLLLGIFAADLISGFVHWACDSWGDEETPWVGPTLIRSFREHHLHPGGIQDHDWVEVNGEAASAAAVAFVALTPLVVGEPRWLPLGSWAFAWSMIFFAGLANQLHQWAHRRDTPGWIGALQRRGFVLSRRDHARHHSGSHDRAYCISTGWFNGLLDAVGFWRGLEVWVERSTGVRPRAGARKTEQEVL